jgi:hypothetical protein
MDMAGFIQLVNGVGFPIAACTGLFWMMNNTMKELTKALKDQREELARLRTLLEKVERGEFV